jgi:hypothetical protein
MKGALEDLRPSLSSFTTERAADWSAEIESLQEKKEGARF